MKSVISKKDADVLMTELQIRIEKLDVLVKGRRLKTSFEGLNKGSWKNTDDKRIVDKTAIEIAVDDFKTILMQIRKLK